MNSCEGGTRFFVDVIDVNFHLAVADEHVGKFVVAQIRGEPVTDTSCVQSTCRKNIIF